MLSVMSVPEIYWLTRIPELATLLVIVPMIVALGACAVPSMLLLFERIDIDVFGSNVSLMPAAKRAFLKKFAIISGVISVVLMTVAAFLPSKEDVRLMILRDLAQKEGINVSISDVSLR